MQHFVDTQDFAKPELMDLLQLIGLLKQADKQGALPPLLADASLGMIFEEPSTRTRVSFEVAMTKLGGQSGSLRRSSSNRSLAFFLFRMCSRRRSSEVNEVSARLTRCGLRSVTRPTLCGKFMQSAKAAPPL